MNGRILMSQTSIDVVASGVTIPHRGLIKSLSFRVLILGRRDQSLRGGPKAAPPIKHSFQGSQIGVRDSI